MLADNPIRKDYVEADYWLFRHMVVTPMEWPGFIRLLRVRRFYAVKRFNAASTSAYKEHIA
jgi:hypothetical protein